MPPPEPDAARIQRWCDNRVPAPFRSRVRVVAEVADRHVTTSQSRPPWGGEGDWISTPVARFRCTRATGLWSLYLGRPEFALPRVRPVPADPGGAGRPRRPRHLPGPDPLGLTRPRLTPPRCAASGPSGRAG